MAKIIERKLTTQDEAALGKTTKSSNYSTLGDHNKYYHLGTEKKKGNPCRKCGKH